MQGRSNSLYLVLRFLRAVLREVKGCFRWSTLSLVVSALSANESSPASAPLCLGLSPSPMLWVSETV
ncbi:hypothetical protein Goari_012284 [Gossypium aridum]|uniref:Uncharacterized protein n=1 Tax=Gossypium aridum TaxID=34290 RepID=A0A7J8X0W3_GOSAI|nr:hypothetical protein [Gossypium aridum]